MFVNMGLIYLGGYAIGLPENFDPMNALTTQGVSVTVQTQYLPEQSSPFNQYYVFSYFVSIENKSGFDIQLMKRYWKITDSNGSVRKIKGNGVIGFQPVIEPNQIHEYSSGCHLETDIGKMKGYYTFQRLEDGLKFDVEIPEFKLITPSRLN